MADTPTQGLDATTELPRSQHAFAPEFLLRLLRPGSAQTTSPDTLSTTFIVNTVQTVARRAVVPATRDYGEKRGATSAHPGTRDEARTQDAVSFSRKKLFPCLRRRCLGRSLRRRVLNRRAWPQTGWRGNGSSYRPAEPFRGAQRRDGQQAACLPQLAAPSSRKTLLPCLRRRCFRLGTFRRLLKRRAGPRSEGVAAK